MDIRQLKYFCTLVEEKSYHKASEKLYLSQPALSQQINALEKELQSTLIRREGRKSLPTEVGLVLYRKAKTIIELTDNTKNQICNYNSNIVGSLKVATSCMHLLLSEKVVDFYKSHPGIFLDIREGHHETVMDYLMSDVCEIAITDYEEQDSKFLRCVQIDEQYFMLAGDKKFLPPDKKSIHISELKGVPLVINRTDLPILKSECVKYGFMPTISAFSDSTENKIHFANTGIGLALGSESCAKMAVAAGMNAVKLEGIDQKIKRCVFWKNDFSLSIAASEFLAMLIDDNNYFDKTKRGDLL